MKTVAVIFGGQSTEHDVSIVTGIASVITPLRLLGEYEVIPIYITKTGQWIWDERITDIKTFQSGAIETVIAKAPNVLLDFNDGLTLVKSSQFAGRKQYKKIDIVFPALHGTNGEDGALMGLLEMANVAYVGCGMPASVIAMDKVLAKQVTGSIGIESTPWLYVASEEVAQNLSEVIKKADTLTYPVFVKPAHLGSSIGITKVDTKKELVNALEVAAHYDDKIIIEQGVANLVEVTLPIIGDSSSPTPALLEEPITSGDSFFDFNTKYMSGGKKGQKSGKSNGSQGYSKIPADLPDDLYKKAVDIGLSVYKALECRGTARVDLLIDSKAKRIYFNEVNPLPGGLYAHNWRKAGLSSVALVENLLNQAVAYQAKKQRLAKTFSTNYLKQM